MSIESHGHFFAHILFQVLFVLRLTRPRYQVSVYRTIGPLGFFCNDDVETVNEPHCDRSSRVPTRYDTNRAVQPQNMARGLKFRI